MHQLRTNYGLFTDHGLLTNQFGEEIKERDSGERKMNESEETEEIKTFPPLPLPSARIAGLSLPNCKQISVGRPVA